MAFHLQFNVTSLLYVENRQGLMTAGLFPPRTVWVVMMCEIVSSAARTDTVRLPWVAPQEGRLEWESSSLEQQSWSKGNIFPISGNMIYFSN